MTSVSDSPDARPTRSASRHGLSICSTLAEQRRGMFLICRQNDVYTDIDVVHVQATVKAALAAH